MQADTTIAVPRGSAAAWPAPVNEVTPRYPDALRERGVEDTVLATFVVDTAGRVVRGSAYITEEGDTAFGDAVCEALRHVLFEPLRIDSRQLSARVVDYPTTFTLKKR